MTTLQKKVPNGQVPRDQKSFLSHHLCLLSPCLPAFSSTPPPLSSSPSPHHPPPPPPPPSRSPAPRPIQPTIPTNLGSAPIFQRLFPPTHLPYPTHQQETVAKAPKEGTTRKRCPSRAATKSFRTIDVVRACRRGYWNGGGYGDLSWAVYATKTFLGLDFDIHGKVWDRRGWDVLRYFYHA